MERVETDAEPKEKRLNRDEAKEAKGQNLWIRGFDTLKNKAGNKIGAYPDAAINRKGEGACGSWGKEISAVQAPILIILGKIKGFKTTAATLHQVTEKMVCSSCQGEIYNTKEDLKERKFNPL